MRTRRFSEELNAGLSENLVRAPRHATGIVLDSGPEVISRVLDQ